MDVRRELLLAAVISLPGFVLPVGALALNRMRRRPAWRPLARVLAFFFLLYALNISYLVVWGGVVGALLGTLPPVLTGVAFIAVQLVGGWASYVAVRDAEIPRRT